MKIQAAMRAVAAFLGHIRSTTEQLKPKERWRLILLAAARAFPKIRALAMAPTGFQMA
jgi:hypothetical protein